MSAALDHNIDSLLVGIVKQIRLKKERRDLEASGQMLPASTTGALAGSQQLARRASSPLRTLQVARDMLSKLCIGQHTRDTELAQNNVDNLLVP